MHKDQFVRKLNEAFFEFQKRQGRRTVVSKFAEYLDVPTSSLSEYMNGVRLPSGENEHKMAARLGNWVYDLLGHPRAMPNDPALVELADSWYQLDEAARQSIMHIVRSRKGDALRTDA